MFTPRLFKSIRTIFERGSGPPLSDELPMPAGFARFNESHQEFMHRAQQIFEERGYEKLNSESTLNGEFLLFRQNEALHLVYCFPNETYVTTIEIQACWETQHRFGAVSSSVVAPHRFSEGAKAKAANLGIELIDGLKQIDMKGKTK